jgi:hypothetical protein
MRKKVTRAAAEQGAPAGETTSEGGVLNGDPARGSIPHSPPDRAWTAQDIANLNVLRALRFTLPVTLDDCVEAYKYAHAMKWSSRPRIDFASHDGKTVEMHVAIGTDGVGTVFNAE